MSEKLLSHPAAITGMVRRVAIKAGHVTLDYFDECGYKDVRSKGDGSPVTDADEAAEHIIQEGLKEILPDIPMVAEELTASGNAPDIAGCEYFWMVDPLDGTKEFVAGRPDYTVNIALIKGSRPILGVVYAPALGVLYAGSKGGKAIKWREDDEAEKQISARRAPAKGLCVFASRSHCGREDLARFLEDYKVAKIMHRGSSIKMCLIAEGKGDLYPRLGPTCEWDTAAADAVLRAAGGAIVDMDGNSLTYGNAARKFLNPYFTARGK